MVRKIKKGNRLIVKLWIVFWKEEPYMTLTSLFEAEKWAASLRKTCINLDWLNDTHTSETIVIKKYNEVVGE